MNKYIQSQMAENNPDMLFCDGFDDAILGVIYRSGGNPVACYSIKKNNCFFKQRHDRRGSH